MNQQPLLLILTILNSVSEMQLLIAEVDLQSATGALGGQIMKEFVGLRAKAYSYFKDSNDKDKTAKGTKKCAIKKNLQF